MDICGTRIDESSYSTCSFNIFQFDSIEMMWMPVGGPKSEISISVAICSILERSVFCLKHPLFIVGVTRFPSRLIEEPSLLELLSRECHDDTIILLGEVGVRSLTGDTSLVHMGQNYWTKMIKEY